MRRLPPMGALRAFEAGARHLNFTLAAQELHVTQAAISHQVRQLETALGAPLFERRGHALTLTAAGRRYRDRIGDALDLIGAATAEVRAPAAGPLHLTVLPSLAACWLLPRLPRFYAAVPGGDVRVTSAVALWDFTDDRFDLALRSGLGGWPGVEAVRLGGESLVPACTPAVAATLQTPADLARVRLVSDTPKQNWRHWFAVAGQAMPSLSPTVYDDAALVIQDAVQGGCVALVRRSLAADALADGRLVTPFTPDLPSDYSYWLVWKARAREHPSAPLFRDWLRAEARGSFGS